MREFDRRTREQAGVETLTGLVGRTAFSREVDRRLESATAVGTHGCVLADLDLLEQVNLVHGRPAGDAVIRATADAIAGLSECGNLSAFGGGLFAVFLPGASDVQAAAWAEQARTAVASINLPCGSSAVRFTASFGVAAWQEGNRTEDVLHRASQALDAAKSSGRNCVARFGEQEDRAGWAELAVPGRLFERTTARDIMTPCTNVLHADDTIARAAAILRRSHAAALPVVHGDGNLVGLVLRESVDAEPAGRLPSSLRISEVTTNEVQRFEENTSFASLRSFFTQDTRSVAAIVRDGKPTGLVTPDDLAALTMPLTTETFAPASSCLAGSEYLLVPDLQPLVE